MDLAPALIILIPTGLFLGALTWALAILSPDAEEGRRADYIDDWQWNDNYYDD